MGLKFWKLLVLASPGIAAFVWHMSQTHSRYSGKTGDFMSEEKIVKGLYDKEDLLEEGAAPRHVYASGPQQYVFEYETNSAKNTWTEWNRWIKRNQRIK